MKMRPLIVVALGVVVVGPDIAFAQAPDRLESAIARATAGTYLQASNASRVTVRDSNANGAIIGAMIGGAAGALAGLGWSSIDENSDAVYSPVLGFMALGAAAGAGVGWVADNAHQQIAYRIRVSRSVTIQLSAGRQQPIRGELGPVHPRIRPIR